MDKYNSIIPRFFQYPVNWKKQDWAVTLGQTAYFTCPESKVSKRWHKHEDCHKAQWAREGRIKFIVKYLYKLITQGYMNNDYEIEARNAALK